MTLRRSICITPACLAFISTVLLTAVGLAALHGQPVAAASPKPGSPQQVADDLDRIIQPRFVQNAGMFGLSRLVPFINGHPIGFMGRFDVETPAEKSLLSHADAANRDYVIAFLHCAHVPGRFVSRGVFQPTTGYKDRLTAMSPHLSTLVMTHNPTSDASPSTVQEASDRSLIYGEMNKQFEKSVVKNLPALRRGKDAQATVAQWTLVMRPVTASTDTCVSCHMGAKKGDTLGVMVYAVGNSVNSVPAASQQVGRR